VSIVSTVFEPLMQASFDD